MSTWIRQPDTESSAAGDRQESAADRLVGRRWHLEGLLPRTDQVVFAACGRSWTLSTTELLEHTQELETVPELVRCEACKAVCGHRITQL